MVIGTATQPIFIRRVKDKAVLAGGKAPPEARLPVGMAGAIVAPVGLLWFALCSFSKMPWIMPMIGTLIFGIGVRQPISSIRARLKLVCVHLHVCLWLPRCDLSEIRSVSHGG